MRGWMGGVLAAGALLASAAQADAASVEFRNAIAHVVVIPEDRADVQVTILKNYVKRPLWVHTEADGRVVVDGGRSLHMFDRIMSCSGNGGRMFVSSLGLGRIDQGNIAQVVVRTPRDAKVEAGGAVYGSIGGSDSLSLDASGCGGWTIGNVKGDLDLASSGTADVRTGAIGRASLRMSGTGNVSTRAISGGATIQVSGMGHANVQQASGPVRVEIDGAGAAFIGGGHASSLEIAVSGMGHVAYDGVADSLDAEVSGVGGVSVAKVTGAVHKQVSGIGTIQVGR